MNQRRDHYWVASAVYPLTIVNETVASLEGGENRPLAAQNSSDVISELLINKLKLSTTDLLVLASMKNAAKCDK